MDGKLGGAPFPSDTELEKNKQRIHLREASGILHEETEQTH